MSKLNIDQKAILDLFSDRKSDFLIPDYQRPYGWGESECQTLWEDIFLFAFPENDYSKFKNDDEYFLGPIVTFKNSGKMEVIDGQQRLTTLMLLLRAFYSMFARMQDSNALATKKNIEKCIWKTNEFDEPNMNELKIDSEVATDNDKEEFLHILKEGKTYDQQKSNYANNFRFFQKKIDDFLHQYPAYFSYLPTRILKNCILLPIEAESQDTALRIFSTLNDRGKPLSDADIFKAQFYKYYSKKGEKDVFIKRWKDLEEVCTSSFQSSINTPMDEIFTRYMYFKRAQQRNRQSTTEALRKFYEKDNYKLLQDDNTLGDLEILAKFWLDVSKQDNDRFSEKVLKNLYVLNFAPNGMWTYFVSVYFLQTKDNEGYLDDDSFTTFLRKIIGFIWAYALTNPGVNALRTPVYAEMIKVVDNENVDFVDFKFDEQKLISIINNYNFYNQRPLTKSMLTWWAYQNEGQPLLSLDTTVEIEHIYARNRQEQEHSLNSPRNIELLGNKSLLEKRINIRASDYRFSDKIKYYQGFETSKGPKPGTKIQELVSLSGSKTDFTEEDILCRNSDILNHFVNYLKANNLTLY